MCLAQGEVLSSLGSSWNVSTSQYGEAINIQDNYTDPNYRIAVYQIDYIKCILANQLLIYNITQDLYLTCIESAFEHGRDPLSERKVAVSK